MLDLRKTLLTTSQALQANGIAHALIDGFALAAYGVNRATVDVDFLADGSKKKEILTVMVKSMTFDEYFEFLKQYWEIFTPPMEPKPKKEYKIV